MILGISIDENFAYVTENGEKTFSLPFSIGRNLTTKTWFIGEETRNENVDNVDIVVDKLYYLMENDGVARIGEEEYSARDLVKFFFNNLLARYIDIEYVTVVVRKNNVKILSKIKYSFDQYFKNKEIYKVTTYSEAFISYLRNKGETYYGNTVSLFDFTEKAITYYELSRYRTKDGREYWQVTTSEYLALPLDLLSGDAGKRVCDNLLLEFAKKCIKEEIYSNIILSGLGFADTSSYREFMTFVCKVANVETDVNFFSKSAIYLSKDILEDKIDKNITIITDARTTASIRLYATINQKEEKFTLVEPGEEWFYIYEKTFSVIPDGSKELKFEIIKVIEGVIKDIPVVIPENMNIRLDKTNFVEVTINFLQQNLIDIGLKDKGFGEFYESTESSNKTQVEI